MPTSVWLVESGIATASSTLLISVRKVFIGFYESVEHLQSN
ncbi:hypothetical protein D920_00173 [Enterococcus faecalis 13-SD-W-01]|nr:hypothetical protein D920_00173 [Enterococcus faecalis 13-SD-W-01]